MGTGTQAIAASPRCNPVLNMGIGDGRSSTAKSAIEQRSDSLSPHASNQFPNDMPRQIGFLRIFSTFVHVLSILLYPRMYGPQLVAA